MRTFNQTAAQGEIKIVRLPDSADMRGKPVAAEGERYVVGHSETGHHHVIDEVGVTVVELDRAHVPEGMRILRAVVERATTLRHLRGTDTHEEIALPPGQYEFRIGREYDPYAELARRSVD